MGGGKSVGGEVTEEQARAVLVPAAVAAGLEERDAELLRARLLLALQDCGFSSADLARVNDRLNAPVDMPEPLPASMGNPGSLRPSALRCIIRGTKAGEAWHIAARVIRTADGQREVLAFVDAGPMAVDNDRTRAVAALDMVNTDRHWHSFSFPRLT